MTLSRDSAHARYPLPCGLGDATVALSPKACDLSFEHVAWPEEAAMVHAVAGGRAGEQQVARSELGDGGDVLDQPRDSEHHVGGACVLHHAAVQPQCEAQ